MRAQHKLWALTISLPPRAAEAFGKAFENASLSTSILAPPRKPTAQLDILFDTPPTRQALGVQIALLAAAQGIPVPRFRLGPVPRLDWLKKVAGDFPPIKIGRWTVHGALHRAKVPNRRYALQIDASSAFGTGEHPTTRGCLLMLDRFLKKGLRPQRVADIGCGSGILSMAWAQVVPGKAVAVDLDPGAASIAKGNVRVNKLGKHIAVGQSCGFSAPLVKKAAPFDLIMANIFAGPLCEMAKDTAKHLAPGGIAILSGLLTVQARQVIAAHRKQGLVLLKHDRLGEWSVLALQRHKRA